jgi:hypothetical protein
MGAPLPQVREQVRLTDGATGTIIAREVLGRRTVHYVVLLDDGSTRQVGLDDIAERTS